MPALIVALLVTLSGGTAAAASGSLPGDALYPIKVNFTEKVASAFHVSDEAKANWKLELADRRLVEAEKLAVEGKLDAELVADIEARFKAHEDRMRSLIDKLEAEGNIEAVARLRSNLEATLTAHAEIMARLNSKLANGEELVKSEVVAGLLKTVHDRKDANVKIRAENESAVKAEFKIEPAVNAQKMAQHKISEVKNFIDRAQAKFGSEAVAEANVRIAAADALMVEGNAKLAAKGYADAFNTFHAAARKAQEAKVMVKFNEEVGSKFQDRNHVSAPLKVESETKVEAEAEVESNKNEKKSDIKIEADGGVKLEL